MELKLLNEDAGNKPRSETEHELQSSVKALTANLSSSKCTVLFATAQLVILSPNRVQCKVLSILTSRLPSRELIDFDHSQFESILLADPNFLEPESVDVILGADLYGQLLKPGLRHFSASRLIAQNTALGWIVSRPVQQNTAARRRAGSQTPVSSLHCVVEDQLQEWLQKFWEVEELSLVGFGLNSEDEACEKLFRDTHTRDSNGGYVVRLPLKFDPPLLASETRSLALKVLKHAHFKFTKDPKLALTYQGFMKVYEELGHMERVPTPELYDPRAWFLAHHAVLQNSPSQWKLRVVFDASRRTREQPCLNEFLMTGAPLQKELALLLLNWRRYKYVFTTDIVKMFRQIRIHPEHRNLQRILWSPMPYTNPVEYRLKTVTYGTSCVPFLAMRTLSQLAQDEQSRFPLGARCIQKNTYVDDIFAGSYDVLKAKAKRDELIELLGFTEITLDKWSANHPDLMPPQPESRNCASIKSFDCDESVKL